MSAAKKLIVILYVLALVATACGSGEEDDAAESGTEASVDSGQDSEESTSGAGDSGDAGSDDGESESVSDEDSAGNRSAVITIDGETLNYSMDDVTFSSVEGIDDLTFETCSADFFGSGRYYAIGYAVDDDGEVIIGDDGGVASQFVVDLPPDDWQETQRDAPEFEITLNDLDLDIATPEQAESMAPGEEMSWTIDDTTASGTAVFVDFENTYVVQFEMVCEGEPTITAGDVSDDPDSDAGDDDGEGGFPLSGAGTGSFVADGESFDGVDVYRCEPFSFGSDPHPDDLSLLAFLGGSSGLEVEVSNNQGFGQGGQTFDQVSFSAFYSRSGDSGLEQFEGTASNDADGNWYLGGGFITEDSVQLDEPPFTISGDRITGELAGLEQTWPDEGAAVVDVSFDFEIPTEVNSEC